jgi:hypothetical protein
MTVFNGVAKMLAGDDPPQWLEPALRHFRGFIGANISADERKEYQAELERMQNAMETLLRLLPAYRLVPGFRAPRDVEVVLDALPRIQSKLAEVNRRRPRKREPMFHPILCAKVIIETSRLVRGKAQPRSEAFTYSACKTYWEACGNQPLGNDIESWRRPVKRAMADDMPWIRDTLQRYQVLQMTP